MVFSWIKNAALKKFAAMHREELEQFIRMLEGVDDETIGLTVALTANLRNVMVDLCDFSDPDAIEDPEALAVELVQLYQKTQKQGTPEFAPGIAVWLHTVRSVHVLENRGLVRKMWGLLARGFPHVVDAAYDFEAMTGTALNTNGYEQIPVGCEPKN